MLQSLLGCQVIGGALMGLAFCLGGAVRGEVLLSDFETPEQLCPLWKPAEWLQAHPGEWCPNGVQLEQSLQHVTEGMFSARLTFPQAVARGTAWPQMFCCPRVRDWSGYKALALDVYSTAPGPISLKFRIDSSGKSGWLSALLPPQEATPVRFPLSELSEQIDPARIDGVILFLDEVPQPLDLFVDHVRLLAKGDEGESEGESGGRRKREQKKVVVARAKEPPVVDGSVAEECWQTAEWHSEFHVLGFPGQEAEPTTSFALRHDGENLYLAVRLEEPEPARRKANVSERDGWVWTDDCVEIFLDTEGRGQRYYHLAVNSKGALYDAQRTEGGASGYPEWNCSAKVVALTPDPASAPPLLLADQGRGGLAWFVEMAIPLADLSFSADRPSTWKINVTRERYVAGHELFTFAPLAGTFHRPQDFALATVQDADLTPFLWAVQPPAEARVFPKQGEMIYQAQLVLENRGAVARMVEVQAALCAGANDTPGPEYQTNVRLAAGSQRKQTFTLTIPKLGQGVLLVTLEEPSRPGPLPARAAPGPGRSLPGRSPPSAGRIVCRRQFPVVLAYEPLVVEVLRPHYRNAIFATQKVEALELRVTTAVAAEERGDYRFEFALLASRPPEVSAGRGGAERGKGQGRGSLKTQEVGVARESVTVTIPLPKLREGDYPLEGRLRHRNGKVLAEWKDTLRVLPPYRGEVRFDENWATLVDGKPFVPFGAWGYYRSPQEVREALQWGFNVVVDNSLPWLSDPRHHDRIKEQLDWYHAAGLRMITPPFPLDVIWFGGGDWTRPLTAKEEERIRWWVRLWKDHPALFAWLLSEEPEEIPALPERLERAYQVVKQEDPYHPCIVVPDSLRGIERYAGGADILMPDPYPNFLRGGGTARGMDYTSRFMDMAAQVARGRKALWITPEAQNLSDERKGEGHFREPTFAELRNQLFQAVAAGAKGFLWYSGGYFPAYPDVGLGGQYLSREVQALQGAILAPPSPRDFTVEPVSEHWRLSRREVGGHMYLLAVSTSEEVQEAAFTVPGLKASRLWVVGEGREVEVRAGRFADRFEPCATHLYTTDRGATAGLDIARVQREIEAAKQALIKPGNLAHQSRGVTVRVSSTGDYCQGPQAINNGEAAMRWWDATREELPDWVELEFPRPEKVARVVVDSNMVHFRIEVERDGQWATVAEVTFDGSQSEEGRQVRTIPFAPVATRRLRITSLAVRSEHGSGHTVVWEVEVYGE